MSVPELVVRGARQHNLRDVTVRMPRDRMIVITGPSGSGKSSLAFDTIYAEGQRRYVESLSAYARQFLDRLPKPDVETIEGLSPAIAIQQLTPSKNPRSTVGTVTEIHDYLRLLFARVGEPHCPSCGQTIHAQTPQQIVDRILSLPEGSRFSVHAPVVRGQKGAHQELLARLRKEGFVRVRVDGAVRDLGEEIALDKRKAHDVDVVVDRLSVKDGVRQRLTEAVELSLGMAAGLVSVAPQEGPEQLFSERFACVECGVSLPELSPRLFSFNNPAGACPTCGGLGEVRRFEADRAIPDPSVSIREGAIAPWGKAGSAWHRFMVQQLHQRMDVDLDRPWKKLPAKTRRALLEGSGSDEGFEGILPGLERRLREYDRRKREQGGNEERAFEYIEEELGRFATRSPCPSCGGARLRAEALAVTLAGQDIQQISGRSVRDALTLLGGLELSPRERVVADRLMREIRSRLGFLVDVGLEYLSLDRAAATLSGGEFERIRLATQIGSGLVGVLYVLDEPSIGLHPRDNARLIDTLLSLRDRGNTVLVVEHDPHTIRAADFVVDMGPAAGKLGGRVVATGTPEEIAADEASLTGAYLSGRRRIEVPARRRAEPRGELTVRDVRTHNLKGMDVSIPLGRLVAVTGVSGSGKSSLVVDTLLPRARAGLSRSGRSEGEVEGLEGIDKIIEIDQSPIGRTPRSNPATYTQVLAPIREIFATLPEARARGYKPGRFSFNVKGGRCEACQGDGVMRIEMHFLPDVFVECEECGGLRYNRETLEIRYRGLHVAEVLGSTVDEAAELFAAQPKVRDKLETLRAVGLGYLELGQSATTLSGGEAQRIKLARELSKRSTGRTLYVLDEPTTGLHFGDVEVLLAVLQQLVDAGNTVVIIEHDLDVVKVADWVVDLGPEGGEGGGELVVAGTPEEVAACDASHTGRYLREVLAVP